MENTILEPASVEDVIRQELEASFRLNPDWHGVYGLPVRFQFLGRLPIVKEDNLSDYRYFCRHGSSSPDAEQMVVALRKIYFQCRGDFCKGIVNRIYNRIYYIG